MLTLINTNRMSPPIGPIGLDYIADSARRVGIQTEVLDLGLVQEPDRALKDYFASRESQLIGLSFRNSDDCFWPSADWFVPNLKNTIDTIRSLSDAPIVLGGVGFSIFADSIFKYCGADFGICGDGESAIVSLMNQLQGSCNFSDVPGLLWRGDDKVHRNRPSWPDKISLGTTRDCIDNRAYFRNGGQCGLETKRGCNRNCLYCADPLAKGNRLRLRKPSEVADEAQSLFLQGIDVLHICDSEFNLSRSHAYAVCEEFIRCSLGDKIRWYTYMLPVPFDSELAKAMSRAGCVGIDFTGDSACESILRTYRHRHSREDIAEAVRLCRKNKIAVMIDLLLGGPSETLQTVQETIDFIKQINPDCAGAALGMRIYPHTAMAKKVIRELQQGRNLHLRRKYTGPIDLLKPTFYISDALGENPADLVKDLIGGDRRFFEPSDQADLETAKPGDASDYNYNANILLQQEIRKGARGAYWDILRRARSA